MNIYIPNEVKFIIDTFYKNNFEAFMVGGCVRDSILNNSPKDYDITTSAKPEDTLSLFRKNNSNWYKAWYSDCSYQQ